MKHRTYDPCLDTDTSPCKMNRYGRSMKRFINDCFMLAMFAVFALLRIVFPSHRKV